MRPIRTLHTDESAPLSLEFLLNIFVIFGFMVLGVAVYRTVATDITAYSETHRRVFTQTTTFFDTSLNIQLNLGPFQPAPNDLLGAGTFFTRADTPPLTLDTPRINDNDLRNLPGGNRLNNGVVSNNRGLARGVGEGFSQLYFPPNFIASAPEFNRFINYEIAREAYAIRPPLTWGQYPATFTQDNRERTEVFDWFTTIRDHDNYTRWVDRLNLRGGFTNDPDNGG
ncbi:MAG: hypothetical protein AAGI30_00505 [Planctomycetota bacterium]